MVEQNMGFLVEKAGQLLETMEQYVSGLGNQAMSVGDWVTVIAAVIAAAVSIVSIVVTIWCDSKNRKSNEKLSERVQESENRRAQAEIDANLTANARIAWIQEVRKATAELIAACYQYTLSDANGKRAALEEVRGKETLLVLYFGPDDDGDPQAQTTDLMDRRSNKGKNDNLVAFINGFYNKMQSYDVYQMKLASARESQRECYGCWRLDEDTLDVKVECKCEVDGIPISQEECQKIQDKTNAKIKEYKKYELEILAQLDQLIEMMRIYEKVEWNRAKTGK